MKTLSTLLLLTLSLLAQDKNALLERARKLDAQAEKLLDQGRRAEAFQLLARAADLRAQRAGEKPRKAKPDTAARKDKARKAAKSKKKQKAGEPRRGVDAAFQRLDEAMEMADMATTLKAARAVRQELERWAKQLARREKRRTAKAAGGSLRERVAALERQVEELKKLLEPSRR